MEIKVREVGAANALVEWTPWTFDIEHKFLCSSCTFENGKASLHCEICGTVREPEFGHGDVLQYQVKYFRTGRSLEPWKYSPVVTECHVSLSKLEPDTTYEIKLKYRVLSAQSPKGKGKLRRKRDKTPSEWTTVPGGTLTFSTISSDHDARLLVEDRIDKFMRGVLEPFPEDPAKPDTVIDKATRVGESVLSAAGMVGVGGKYAMLARQVYKMQKSGLAAVVLREDIQKMVIALTSYVGSVAREFGLSSMDITLGSYYMIWEAKREQLLYPDMDKADHAGSSASGVLQSSADLSLFDGMARYFGFCEISYRPTAAQMQWVLHQYPSRQSEFRLLACRCRSDKFRPAFALMASRKENQVVLAIRGTKEADDLITDFDCEYEESAFSFHTEAPVKYKVHTGMLRAAKWMLRSGSAAGEPDSPDSPPNGAASQRESRRRRDADLHAQAGAGLAHALLRLHKAGFKVAICGHSLGAGVGTLMALLLVDMDRTLEVEVFGFGSPACVDERLAEACKGEDDRFRNPSMERIPGLGRRVRVHNLVFRDDLVARLSLFNARLFAADIKRLKPTWKPLLEEDKGAYKKKAKSLWAPAQRAHQQGSKRSVATGAQAEPSPKGEQSKSIMRRFSRPRRAPDAEEAMFDEEDMELDCELDAKTLAARLQDPPERMVIAGLVLHVYTWRGTQHVSLIDYRYPGLRRIEPSETLITDHKLARTHDAFRNVRAARRIGEALSPPPWQSVEDHHAQGLYVNCGVCDYFVGWHLTGESEAVEIRATHHCYSCGKIVCARCSTSRTALPHLGLVTEVRVCDSCYARLASPVA